MAFAQTADEPRQVGSWSVWDIVDPIDDSRRAGASARGENGTIVVKCDASGPNSLYVQFLANEYLGGDGGRIASRPITYRFDSDQPATSSWRYDDSYALLSPGREASAFISRLTTAERVVIRATTYRHRAVDAVIALESSAEALGLVAAACGAAG